MDGLMKQPLPKCAYCQMEIALGSQRHPTDWGILCAYCFSHVWGLRPMAKKPSGTK